MATDSQYGVCAEAKGDLRSQGCRMRMCMSEPLITNVAHQYRLGLCLYVQKGFRSRAACELGACGPISDTHWCSQTDSIPRAKASAAAKKSFTMELYSRSQWAAPYPQFKATFRYHTASGLYTCLRLDSFPQRRALALWAFRISDYRPPLVSSFCLSHETCSMMKNPTHFLALPVL